MTSQTAHSKPLPLVWVEQGPTTLLAQFHLGGQLMPKTRPKKVLTASSLALAPDPTIYRLRLLIWQASYKPGPYDPRSPEYRALSSGVRSLVMTQTHCSLPLVVTSCDSGTSASLDRQPTTRLLFSDYKLLVVGGSECVQGYSLTNHSGTLSHGLLRVGQLWLNVTHLLQCCSC